MIFQPCGLVGDHCVGSGMSLVESVFRKAHHAVEDLICRLLIDPLRRTPGNVLFFISVDEVLPLLRHDGGLLLGHGSAHQVAPAK